MRTHDRYGAIIRPDRSPGDRAGVLCTEEGCPVLVDGPRRRLCEKHKREHRAATLARHKDAGRYERSSLEARCRKYGITIDEYQALLDQHGHRCAICGGTGGGKALAIDHDHVTGNVRGVLCSPCNVAIAFLFDSPSNAESAAAYLRAAGH